jgi:GDP/UDP-N,N'-diacetylbacillosamine 2-epimerase (hydrolysing)
MNSLMKRKICVVTGSRADYGLLRWVMEGIKDNSDLTLQVIVTGMHLSSAFGNTYKDVEADGILIDRKVVALSDDDSPVGIAESMSNVLAGCAEAFRELKPDIVVVLGDRFEIFAAASAALVAKIPIAHLHGGESTVGAFDEAMRHSITKMSQIHFVAAKAYADRVVQLGETPSKVFNVGGLGIDNIKNLNLLSLEELETSLQVELDKQSLLVTFHPVTLEDETGEHQMRELLNALSELKDTSIIFTMPNADTGGRRLTKMINEYVSQNVNSRVFTSLGQLQYLSCLAHVDAMVGNSSSGLIEAPSFKKGTINIGDRQLGRLQATSVINCPPEKYAISAALEKLYSADFQTSLAQTINPYGEGGASLKIVEILSTVTLDGILKKIFHDL